MSQVIDCAKIYTDAISRMDRFLLGCSLEHFCRVVVFSSALCVRGIIKREGIEVLHRILREDLELSDEEADQLANAVSALPDDKSFYSDSVLILHNSLGIGAKVELISQIWELILSDHHLHEDEANFILALGAQLDVSQAQVSDAMTPEQPSC